MEGTKVRDGGQFVVVNRMLWVGLMEKIGLSKDWKDVRGE